MSSFSKRVNAKLIRGFDWTEWLVSWTWWVYILVVIFISWEVIMRYFFNRPHIWFEEVNVVTCLFVSFLGCGVATKENEQIAFTAIDARLKGKGKNINKIIIYSATIIVDIILIMGIFSYANSLNRLGAIYESNMPYSFVAYAIVIGLVFSLLYVFRVLWEALLNVTRVDVPQKPGPN